MNPHLITQPTNTMHGIDVDSMLEAANEKAEASEMRSTNRVFLQSR
jgi:hypothetical protein